MSLFKSIITRSFSSKTRIADGSGISRTTNIENWNINEQKFYLPAICGDDVMTWKSIMALSIWSTLVVWPRRIVKKYADGLGGGAFTLELACCESVWSGIPPEKIINVSLL